MIRTKKKLLPEHELLSIEHKITKSELNRTRYLKENPKGVNEMCKILEAMKDEAEARGKILGAVDLARKMNMTDKQIEEYLVETFDISNNDAENYLKTASA